MKQPGNVPGEIRFGNIAMSKGFITGEQLVNAINTQIKNEEENLFEPISIKHYETECATLK